MKKLLNSTYKKMIVLLLGLVTFSTGLTAQCKLLNEKFDVNPVLSNTNVDGTWYPDRYRPAGFVSDVLAGSNVLKISIDGVNDGLANRPPAYQSTFYNTQGRKINQCGGCVTVSKADVYIPADWATKHRRTDMWATAYDNTNSVSAYPIIGFRNPDGISPGIYYWDNSSGWVNSGLVVVYNSWYNVEFRLVAGNIDYYVNNVLVASTPGYGSAYCGDIIMQAYNFNDPGLPGTSGTPDTNPATNSYDAYWDNLITTGTNGNVVTNINSGETFCSIQAAINAANTLAGHTIVVGPGTYNENVNVNKGVTIKSSGGKAVTIVNGSAGGPLGTFQITANNVTIGDFNQGFTINGYDGPSPGIEVAAIYIQGAHSNITIRGNEIVANGDEALLTEFGNAVNNLTVNANVISGKTFVGAMPGDCGFGNQFSAPNVPRQLVVIQTGSGVTFTSNTITGTAGGPSVIPACTAFGQGNSLVTIDANNVTVRGNTFAGTTTRFGASFRARGTNVSINCNTFNNAGLGLACTHIEFNGGLTALSGGASPNTLAGVASQNTFLSEGAYFIGAANIYRSSAQVLAIPQVPIAANSVVNATVTNTNTGEKFCSIQSAIDDPNTLNGHTISVGSGTYNESVIITKALTLNGPNVNMDCSGLRVAEAKIVGTGGTNNVAVKIASDNVTVNGFAITNPTGSYGVVSSGRSNINILYNVVSDIGNNVSGSGVTYGVQIESSSPASNVNIQHNCVSNIRGGQSTPTASSNGSANGIGANSSNSTADLTGLNISYNIISGISACATNGTGGKGAYGVIINVGAAAGGTGKALSSVVSNNSISNLNGRWTHGVGLEGDTPGAMVINNDFSSFTSVAGDNYGVTIQDDDNASSVQIHENSFLNSGFGIGNAMSPAVDATCNWYGSSVYASVAAMVAGNLTFAPYLNNGTDNSATVGFQPVPGSCSGGIPRLSTQINGVTVNSNGDGIDDLGAFTVCPGTNNILFNSFTDQNGLSNPQLKVYQTWISTSTNVSVPFCDNCWATMAAFANAIGTLSLLNPSLPGTLVIRFRSWIDTDNSGTINGGELASDWIQYTITLNPQPILRETYNGVQVTADNNGIDDNGAFAVCTSNIDNVFLTEIADLQNITPTSKVRVEQQVIKTGVNINTAADGIYLLSSIGPIPLGRTATLINPAVGGTVVIKRRAFYDANNNNLIDPDECPGDWVVYTITVNPQPILSCPGNVSVSNTPGLCSAVVNYAVGLPTSPAPTVTYSFSGATTGSGSGTGSGSAFNKGVTMVVVTSTNDCGTQNCSFTVTVNDVEPPQLTGILPGGASGNLCISAATPAPSNATIASKYTDNCGAVIATLINSSVIGSNCNWTATYTYSVKDPSNNFAANAIVVYTGGDIEPPVITANGTTLNAGCNPSSAAINAALGTATATDNCGVGSPTFVDGNVVISGCGRSQTRTWNVSDACGNPAIPVSRTVNWTVDITPPVVNCKANAVRIANLDMCTYTVTGAEFDVSSATDNCSIASIAYILSGATTGSGNTTLNGVLLNKGVTTIKWTATDQCGNSAFCTSTVTVTDNQNSLNSYTIVGFKDVKLGQTNIVNGSVGNTATDKKAKVSIDKNSSVSGFVKANVVDLKAPVAVAGGVFLSPATVTLPTMQFNTAIVPAGNFNVPDNTPGIVVINTNYNNLTIGKNTTVTINGTIYGKVSIKEGATVTFTQNVVDISDITLEPGKPNTNYTTTYFNGTTVRVKNTIKVADRCRFIGTNTIFFMGDATPDNEKVTVGGNDTWFTGNVLLPDGTLGVHGGGKDGLCIMTGTFMAENISSDDMVTWNGLSCNAAPPVPSFVTAVVTKPAVYQQPVLPVTPVAENFKVTIYPNPTPGDFNIQVISNSSEPVKVKIMDMTGVTVQASTNITKGGLVKLANQLPGGTYFVEVTQGKNKQVLKLFRMN